MCSSDLVGLDALAQKQVKLLFRRLAEEKKTVFLTTHTLSVAEAVCDRIAIINHGKIVASGTTAELKSDRALEDAFLELTYDTTAGGAPPMPPGPSLRSG